MSSDAVKVLNQDNFQSTIENGVSIVDFWAEWCGPCKMQKPIIEELAQKASDLNVCQVDTDQNQELASKFNVMSIPTIILFKDGKMMTQMVGLQSIENLEEAVQKING